MVPQTPQAVAQFPVKLVKQMARVYCLRMVQPVVDRSSPLPLQAMEPVSVVVNALAAGAKAALPSAAKQVVKDGYEILKALLKKKFAQVDVTPVERNPESLNKRGSVAEDLQAVGADRDADVLGAATRLLELIEKHSPDAGRAVGVDLAQVKARAIELRDITATGFGATGVTVNGAEITGDIRIRGVSARTDGAEGPSNPR